MEMPAWNGSPRAARRGPAPPRCGREDTPGVWLDLGQFARWALARGLAPGAGRPEGRAPLHRPALRSKRGPEHNRTQAGGPPCPVRQPARARTDRPEPGRPGEHAAALVIPATRAQGEGGRQAAGRDPCGRSSLEQRDRALFELAYACGLRAEELVSLKTHRHRLRRRAAARRGQGRKTRYLPVGEVAMAAVRLYMDGVAMGSPPQARREGVREKSARCSCQRLENRWARATCAGDCGCGPRARKSRAGRRRTLSGTALRRTCSTAERTCGASRSCSAMQACRAPRFTLG